MKARERILLIISTRISPLLQQAGFYKSGIDFYRRKGEVVQAIQIQLSASNFYDHGHFYVNVGLNFDRVYQLEQKPVLDLPKEFQCHFRRRLEQIIPDVPPRWEVHEGQDQLEPLTQLQIAFQKLVTVLDGIDSLERFLALDWLHEGADLGLRAQLHYILGERSAAIRDLQDPFFRSRPDWDLTDWLAQCGLGDLEAALNQEVE